MRLFCVLPLGFLLCTSLMGAGPHKNVVMIVTDDQGLQAGCYGDPVIKTPNIDKLAAEGTRFNYAFCTTSSCSASRSVILTGLHNHRNCQYGHEHRQHHFQTRRGIRTLPVLLSRAGYKTCRIGKYHVRPMEIYKFDVGYNVSPRNPVQMVAAAKKFLSQNDRNPFFIYICPSDPHREGAGFSNGPRDGVVSIKYHPKDIPVPPYLPDKPEVRKDLAEYYQAVSRADQCLGGIMQLLKETGHRNDTLILFLSDNGLPFPVGKTNLYEPGVRLPLVVRSPSQQKRGVVTNAMVTWTDLTPTILDYCGVEGPKYKLHGRSFLSVLDQSDPSGWDEIYLSHSFHEITMYYPMRAVRTRKHKYILNLAHQLPYPISIYSIEAPTWKMLLNQDSLMLGERSLEAYRHRPRHELFDLQADPLELHNLAECSEHAELLKNLQNKLRQWREKTQDPWLESYEEDRPIKINFALN